ncbi:uncharacterized protein LOC121419005 [Lytechinus variegatus]|uniref:uncharacterized protein LOC121419005 n=1 Tax=Lytechinus variegatus TaxID=7654 RepID=UPI001BB1D269|nr:uncharacterized protein LOC121419005 [Lytechinus variegatus]
MYLESCMLNVVLLYFVGVYNLAEGLQCYRCSSEDTNDNCIGSNNIQTCSITQDRCLTQVTYSRERGKLGIDKSCASVQGCNAAIEQLSKYYFCDKSRAGWGCVECCPEDRCNESRGVNIHQQSWIPLITSIGIIFYYELCR